MMPALLPWWKFGGDGAAFLLSRGEKSLRVKLFWGEEVTGEVSLC